jgi:predicted AlkP superfamily pyrophosphatase or phosphodiesterase
VKVILYFSDAFAWNYLESTDFMPDFWTERRPLETVLGYSSTILPCLISGQSPQRTGIWTEYYRHDRPQGSLARWVVRSRVLLTPVNLARLILFRFARKAGHPAAHLLRIPLQLAHFFARHDMDYRKFPPVVLPVPTFADAAAGHGLRFSFKYLKHGYDLDAELADLDRRLADNDVLFYYDPSVDGHGHHAGADARALKPDIDRVGAFCEHAWQRIGADPEAHLLLFSDHGMTDVKHAYDLFARLAPWRIGHDYLVFVDSTFARFWYASDAVRDGIRSALADAPAVFLTAEDERRYGIAFDDDRYGQEILVADEAVVFHPSYISPTFFRTKQYPDRATHGYLPECATAYGIYLRRGPGADRYETGAMPATGLYGVVEAIMSAAVQDRAGHRTA